MSRPDDDQAWAALPDHLKDYMRARTIAAREGQVVRREDRESLHGATTG